VGVNIRDRAILNSASGRLEDLIEACRRGGGLHAHAPHRTAEVSRKAKSLRTSLAGLAAALEAGVEPPPEQEKPVRKSALLYRLYSSPLLYEMVRFVGAGGRKELEFWDFYRELAPKYSQEKTSAALHELLDFDKSIAVTQAGQLTVGVCMLLALRRWGGIGGRVRHEGFFYFSTRKSGCMAGGSAPCRHGLKLPLYKAAFPPKRISYSVV